jgi:hypothetical protein
VASPAPTVIVDANGGSKDFEKSSVTRGIHLEFSTEGEFFGSWISATRSAGIAGTRHRLSNRFLGMDPRSSTHGRRK